VAWDRVTHADVVRAVNEYDRLGPKRVGFARSRVNHRAALPPTLPRDGPLHRRWN
jgi:hypothetical protein